MINLKFAHSLKSSSRHQPRHFLGLFFDWPLEKFSYESLHKNRIFFIDQIIQTENSHRCVELENKSHPYRTFRRDLLYTDPLNESLYPIKDANFAALSIIDRPCLNSITGIVILEGTFKFAEIFLHNTPRPLSTLLQMVVVWFSLHLLLLY